jgi:DMSO/TMAO reductase YedYZ molybdopterin-dependent catalytic subunit
MKFYSYVLLFFMVVVTKFSVLAQEKEGEPYIKVEGEVTQPLKLYQSDLEKMKRMTLTHKDRDLKEQSYTGVPVAEILSRAGVTMGKQLRGENLAKYLLVTAADGYQVVFSLAELDSSYTDKQVILADKVDGKPLPGDKGPFQLIVPGEKKQARSCFQVNTFIIRFAKD